MPLNYDFIIDVIIKVLGQSCTVKLFKNGQWVFPRNLPLIFYSITISILIPFSYHVNNFYQSNNFDKTIMFFNYALFLSSVVCSFLYDSEYRICLVKVERLGKSLNKKLPAENRKPLVSKCAICSFTIIMVFGSVALISFSVAGYFVDTNASQKLMGLILTFNINYFLNIASFGKIIIILYKFIDNIAEINSVTRKYIEQISFTKLKILAGYYIKCEELFLTLNPLLNMMLLLTLTLNFLLIFVLPYIMTVTYSMKVIAWSFGWHDLFVVEFLKLYVISQLGHKLTEQFSEWWNIVLLSSNREILNEMRRRGIHISKRETVSLRVYDMFTVDKNYIKMVLLTTLSYAVLIMQYASNYNEIIKSTVK